MEISGRGRNGVGRGVADLAGANAADVERGPHEAVGKILAALGAADAELLLEVVVDRRQASMRGLFRRP